ncbi:flagellar C1a complex subunit C1a-32-domain-containing protein [Gaertneriomyces semiglobifer]|nr:flagellar C1a complex subunit C1a-32-domain-containing protein [Gaertneriomyces semiglobifer]
MKQVHDLLHMQTNEQTINYMERIFGLKALDPKDAIVLDFYYYNIRFAKDHGFSPEQASAFFSIMKRTHAQAVASPYAHLDEDYSFFKDTLLHHAVHRPPFSQQIFSLAQVRAITEYAVKTYFRHYLMYKYVFTKKMRLNLRVDQDATEIEQVMVEATDEDTAKEATAVETEAVPEPSAPSEDAPLAQESEGESLPQSPEQVEKESVKTADTVPAQSEEITKITDTVGITENRDVQEAQTTPQEIAARELATFVSSTLSIKLDDLRKTLLTKLQAQEEQINSRLRKLEDSDDKSGKAKGKKK